MKITTDGTTRGTRVLDEHGDLLSNVTSVERQGRNVYVTRRYRDLEIEGAPEGDFFLTTRSVSDTPTPGSVRFANGQWERVRNGVWTAIVKNPWAPSA